jgi:hypothetical protein
VFSRPSESDFVRINILEILCRGGVTTLESRDALARRKVVATLVYVKRLCGRWRPVLIEVQGNLCGRAAVELHLPKQLNGKLYTDGFT